jgi:hypothetical protein
MLIARRCDVATRFDGWFEREVKSKNSYLEYEVKEISQKAYSYGRLYEEYKWKAIIKKIESITRISK